MIKLTINNSTSSIAGLNVTQFKELSDLMSYSIDAQAAYFSRDYRSRKRSLLNKRGEFPTGLVYIAEKYLWEQKISVVIQDTRKRPIRRAKTSLESTIDLPLGQTPYPEQLDACKAAINDPFGAGIIVAPTGSGKSLIVVLLCAAFKVKTLIVVPSLELKRQLTETIATLLPKLKHLVTVENVDSIDPSVISDADMLIIDEFHHSGAKTYRNLNKKAWKNIYYRWGLTATPFRSQDNERLLLESVLSKVIYRIDYHQAVKNKRIVPMEAYYIQLPKVPVKGFTWAQVYSELVVNNVTRNKIIQKLLISLYKGKKSTLCLVKEIKHGELLSSAGLLKEDGFDFANGLNENTKDLIQAFNNRSIITLLGTNGILGEGIDTKPAEFVIIAGLGKSKNAFMQQCGRSFRVYPGKDTCKIILFRDDSHKFTRSHFKAQCKYLEEEYGVKPALIEI